MTDVIDRDALDELDARWCAVEDAYALDELPEHAPPPADPRLVSAWERERAFYAALAQQASGRAARDEGVPAPSAEDLALVDAVLARHEAVGEPPHGELLEHHRRSPATRWVALALAMAAAVVLTVFALTPELGLRGSEGSWIAEGGQRRSGPGDALPMAVWLVAEGPACAMADESSVCASEGTVLRVQRSGGDPAGAPAQVEVRRGSVTVDGTLTVQTPAGELHGDATAHFAVTVSEDDGLVDVDVQAGALQLSAPAGTRVLEAGQRVRLGDVPPAPALVPPASEPTAPTMPAPAPASARPSERASRSNPGPASDPAALLVQARARLGEGDERGAAKIYSTLIDAHPSSAEAQAARVSLGQLRLASGRPKAALALFDRYLQRGGPLTEEALWGKIQALSALGRGEELAAAVDRLVHDLPRSVYRARAQALVRR